jgi:hypothetical protein
LRLPFSGAVGHESPGGLGFGADKNRIYIYPGYEESFGISSQHIQLFIPVYEVYHNALFVGSLNYADITI